MSINITYLGHSGFTVEGDGHTIAIDPFLTDNPVATIEPDAVRCGSIALTHGHADHVGDTVDIARNNDATLYAAFEICEYLGGKGVKNVQPMNPGGKVATDFGFVALTQAFHSSSYEGRYMGLPCGVIINIAGFTLYHCGDTALFGDMELIGEIYRPDIAMIPIGDRFTMGPELATRAAELIRPKVAIPIHYKTWPLLVQEASGFRPSGVEMKELKPGEQWRYG